MQLLGERACDERGRVDPLHRRVERLGDRQLRRRSAARRRPFLLAAGQPVRDVPRRRRSGPTRPSPAARRTRPACVNPGGATGRRGRRGGGPRRAGAARGHSAGRGTPRLVPGGTSTPRRAARMAANSPSATPTWHSAPVRSATWSIRRSAARSSRLEVAGGAAGRDRDHARPDDLDADRELLDGGGDGFEQPRVPHRVVGEDDQLRAAPLRVPATHPAADALGPGQRGAGHDTVGRDHRDRLVRREPGRRRGGRHRPVGAPHDEHPFHASNIRSNDQRVKRVAWIA